jgi:hypothetical protein
MTFVADYPAAAVERKILTKAMTAVGVEDEEFGKRLVEWAGAIRKTNREGGLEETITTRRLVQIAREPRHPREPREERGTRNQHLRRDHPRGMLNLYKKVDDEAEPKVKGQDELGQAPKGPTAAGTTAAAAASNNRCLPSDGLQL